jgi:hypothetical protein
MIGAGGAGGREGAYAAGTSYAGSTSFAWRGWYVRGGP